MSSSSERKPTAALMRPYALVYIYRARLRAHAVQELLAGIGVAAAVALIFAVMVANASIGGSAGEVIHTITGPASLQLRARGPEGFDEHLLADVEGLAGVKQAAPLLEESAVIVGPYGRHVTVDLAGADISLAILDGLAHTIPRGVLSEGGIGLTNASADALGLAPPGAGKAQARDVSLKLRGSAFPLRVTAVLGPGTVHGLAQALVAFMPLERLQLLAQLPGRISRILVQTKPGAEQTVRTELQRLAGGHATVAAADQDLTLLHQALRPSNLASGLFAAIAGLLGFLFAFNAMLLSVPERRQAIADLRLSGTRRTAIVEMVMFQALLLGLAASLLGLLAGYALALGVLHQSAGYLSETFLLGRRTILGVLPIALALAGGILATCVPSAVPLLDLRRRRAVDAVYFEQGIADGALGARAQWRLALAAIVLLTLATIAFLLAPALALLAAAALALTTTLMVPVVFAGALGAAGALAERAQNLTILPVALASLKTTTLRSLALAATGALALFGAITLGGARDDLLHGLHGYTATYVAQANIWVLNRGEVGAVTSISPAGYTTRIARIPGVASVGAFQGEFANQGGRRIWLIAQPPDANGRLLCSQIVTGNCLAARKRLREGGWVGVSTQIAREQHVGLGGPLKLSTPTGTAYLRIAALTSNFAWTGGAVLMNTSDYARLWDTRAPTALGVDLNSGANAASVQREITAALGPASGLQVLTAPQRANRINAIAAEGLSQLAEISTLLVFAAILAMASALGSAIWQRHASFAELRLSGAKPARLRRILLCEATLILGASAVTGILAGIYGQAVIDGYLKHTGFPVARLAATWRPVEILLLVTALVLAIAAIPGWLASRVSPAVALEND